MLNEVEPVILRESRLLDSTVQQGAKLAPPKPSDMDEKSRIWH